MKGISVLLSLLMLLLAYQLAKELRREGILPAGNKPQPSPVLAQPGSTNAGRPAATLLL